MQKPSCKPASRSDTQYCKTHQNTKSRQNCITPIKTNITKHCHLSSHHFNKLKNIKQHLSICQSISIHFHMLSYTTKGVQRIPPIILKQSIPYSGSCTHPLTVKCADCLASMDEASSKLKRYTYMKQHIQENLFINVNLCASLHM